MWSLPFRSPNQNLCMHSSSAPTRCLAQPCPEPCVTFRNILSTVSCRVTLCRLPATGYSIYLHLPSIYGKAKDI
jgi:hypothetical protein